jgi:hypothetical protein
MSGPTFVATFNDDEITRMTIYCADGKLDLARGVRLSRQAYRARKGKAPPAMTAGHFEKRPDDEDGDGGASLTLKAYTPKELAAVEDHPSP